jgi:hypothetical protein
MKHGGIGPGSLNDLDEKARSQIPQMERSPWEGVPGVAVSPPYTFLVPKAKFAFSGPRTNRVLRADRNLLAMELTPFVDDGKHWVTYTDNSTERVEIDPVRVKQYELKIHPVMTSEEADEDKTKDRPHVLLALRESDATGPLDIPFKNTMSGDSFSLKWKTSACVEDAAVTNDLRHARTFALEPYAALSSSPVIESWSRSGRLRNAGTPGRRGRGETTSAFAIMGGRAAVRETLQMQQLAQSSSDTTQRTIPISDVAGVVVKSHPFEDMLAGKAGGQLTLANVVPPDQFMIYVAKPGAILPLLDDGADFLSNFGSVAAGNSIKYDLNDRYLARLGMDKKWLQRFLESDAVKEMAIVSPDLFFIDGTDISVVSRLSRPKLIGALLKLIGVVGLSDDGVVTRRTEGGKAVYWSMRRDLLFVSTHREALAAMVALHEQDGEGSLGQSAEFRYMLTQLPVEDDTRLYAYLSDPFVRRLVGPGVKIAQLRRMTARAEMEHITSMALMARLEGKSLASVETLVKNDYLPDGIQNRGYSLDREFRVHSASHGSLAQMRTFAELPVKMVSEGEARLYKAYVENYARFWRQFFDPIAMRLDDTPDGALELTTFILPLIDNSIYNGLKEALHTREDGQPLKNPILSPPPLLKLSLNLKESSWTQISKGLYEIFDNYAHINPAALDDLGPGFHLAIHDADPVITLGSGDLLGAFGGNMTMRNSEMLMIPMLLSVLTRPCTLIIETQDPDRTRRYLRQAAAGFPYAERGGSWFDANLHQVSGRDEWIFTLNMENVIKLRYGLQVDGSHVLVRNIPWSSEDRILHVQVPELRTARIEANPGACLLQLPGLHAAASDGARAAAVDSMGHIYPLLLSGVATLGNVEAIHQRLFGFYPVHPGEGHWTWNGSTLSSTKFGSALRQSAPAYDAEDPVFGALKDIDTLQLGMQFEETGLRTKVRWKLK